MHPGHQGSRRESLRDMAGADPQIGCRAYNRPRLQPLNGMFVGSSSWAARKVITTQAHAHQALSLMGNTRSAPFVLHAAVSGLQLMEESLSMTGPGITVLTAGAVLTR